MIKTLYIISFIGLSILNWPNYLISQTLFTPLSHQASGINFENRLIESPQNNIITYEYFYNGGGVAAGDFNNDGWIDLYFTSNMGDNKLFLNTKNFNFTDITKSAGVAGKKGWKTGVSVADVNGDGWLDIYVCYSGDVEAKQRTNQLFINNKNLTFTERGAEYGINDSGHSTHAAFFDFDRDGDLDLYVLNHNVKQFRNFDAAYVKKSVDPDAGDRLYENVNGKFKNVTEKAGIKSNPLGYGLGLSISDFNNDGWPDIYVSNDYVEEDYLYINNKNGTYTETLKSMIDHISNFSMGIDAGDINNDGLIDIVTLDMLPEDNKRQKLLFAPDNFEVYNNMVDNGFYHQIMRNMLQLNNGNGTYSEIGQLAGISNTDWSWSALLADYDNDGYQDLFVTNGYGRDMINRDFMKFYADERTKHIEGKTDDKMFKLLQTITSTPLQNYIYKNNGDLTFTNKVKEWGIEGADFSHGAVYADLDNDGDLDLVTNKMNNFAGVFRNNSEALKQGNYVQFSLAGSVKNNNAIGAKITVFTPKGTVYKENYSVHGFQSSIIAPIHFGLPSAIIDSVIINWPDGTKQLIKGIQANKLHSFTFTNVGKTTETAPTIKPIFKTKITKLPFKHEELIVNDFKVQPLMPNMVSLHGPKLSKGDVNGDGLEDIFMPGPEGKEGNILLQSKDGSFIKSKQKELETDAKYEDAYGLLFDADNDKDLDLWVVSGGFGAENSGLPLTDRLYINTAGVLIRKENWIPKDTFAGSIAVAWDYDDDGDMDVFVGGRVSQGNYPLSPGSKLYQNNGKGEFIDVTSTLAKLLNNNEMVTFALVGIINNKSTLFTCGEWSTIKTYQFNAGQLVESTTTHFNDTLSGWWNTFHLSDMDNDGDLDIIAGNWGLNAQFKPSKSEPMELYYDDFDKNGYLDPLWCYYIQGKSWPTASRDELTDQIVALRKKYVTYTSYAEQQLKDVLPHLNLDQSRKKTVNTLETTWFENVNGKFEKRTLPKQANFSPVYAITSDDYNNDGLKDILLGGNIAYARIRVGKNEATYGVLLLGNKDKSFTYASQIDSGLDLKGCVRSFQPITNEKGERKIIVGLNNENPTILTVEQNIKKVKLEK